MKITDIIPGEQINNADEIIKSIMAVLNPGNLPPAQLWKELKVLDKEVAKNIIIDNSDEQFYLLYTVYKNNKAIDRVFVAEKERVICFIEDNFIEEYDEGIDIIISDTGFHDVIMGNHDCVFVTHP